jgi:outer membrane protein
MLGSAANRVFRLALLVACAAAAFAEEPIRIEDAIDLALKQNRDLQVTALNLESQVLSVKSARSDFSISIKPGGNANSSVDSDSFEYGGNVSKKTTWGTTAEVDGRWSKSRAADGTNLYRGTARFELRQPLLRQFGPLVNREPVTRAESAVTAARREVELRKNDLVVQVVESYEELFRLQKQVEFDSQAVERAEKLLRLTSARVQQGRATRVDELRVELQRGDAQLRLSRTVESLKSLQADFAELLGFAPDRAFMAGDMPVLKVAVPGADEAVRVALSNRLDYAQVLQDCRDAARGVRIARRNLLPDLNLISRYELSDDGPAAGDANRFGEESWFVGLTAETDLNRTKDRISAGQAVLTGETARRTVEIVESGVRRQVRQALLAHDRAQAGILFAQRNLHLAESRAALARKLFEIGRGDNFSATDAESALQQAQNEMLSAQADASVAAYRLLRTVGSLLECPDDLKPKEDES